MRPPLKIHTHFVYPPIPSRDSDWVATTDNYEPGDPAGHGRTEAAAIADLRIELELAEHPDLARLPPE